MWSRTEDEVVQEEAEATEVVESAWKEGDVVGIKVCDKKCSVDLGGATAELLSGTCVMRSKQGVRRWELCRDKCGCRRGRWGNGDVKSNVTGSDGRVRGRSG